MPSLRRSLSALARVGVGTLLFTGALVTLAAANSHDRDHAGDSGAGDWHIRGTVTSVDYRRAVIRLRLHGGTVVVVAVPPSTSFESKDRDGDQYHALTDIHVGQRIEADVSRVGDVYEAEMIQLGSQ